MRGVRVDEDTALNEFQTVMRIMKAKIIKYYDIHSKTINIVDNIFIYCFINASHKCV